MVFALGKFTSLKRLRLLDVFGKSTMQTARGARVLSGEGDISLPRLKMDVLYGRETMSSLPLPCKQAQTSGVYYPEILKSMRLAFDIAWNRVSSRFDDPETARQILAKQILHHADRGQRKVWGLATAAANDVLALTGACGDRRS
jgi:hypothetical protein